jgi:hypothetical protein
LRNFSSRADMRKWLAVIFFQMKTLRGGHQSFG